MINPIAWYTHWLHTRWPAGGVEKLPVVQPDGSTNVPGLYIVGDLTGIPLLKFSADTGTRAVMTLANDPGFIKRQVADPQVRDLAIVGGGVSGFAAAKEAKKQGLTFELFEAAEPFSTIANFPTGKPIFTYPTGMTPAGDLQFHDKAQIKEGLLEDLHDQTLDAGITPTKARVEKITKSSGVFELHIADGQNIKAHRVIVGIGRSGNFRKLDIPGEDLDKVYNRLHDPKDFCGQNILVVGGGDSAMETAIALATCGSKVTLSYRKPEFSRPKPENVEKLQTLSVNPKAAVGVEQPTGDRVSTASGEFMGPPDHEGSVRLLMASNVVAIHDDDVLIKDADGKDQTIPNDAVFEMIGREPPLDFFRKSGVKISGEMTKTSFAVMLGVLLFMTWIYHWKSNKPLPFMSKAPDWLRSDLSGIWRWVGSLGNWWQGQIQDPATLLGTLNISASGGAFFYSLAYCIIVAWFGYRRIKRRKTPYIKLQTTVLACIQIVPLFLLPEIVLPLLQHNGAFDSGFLNTAANGLFPEVSHGHGREFWRAYGFILAFPLMVWNLFTAEPLWWWIVIAFLQTFVLIPALIWRYGKGAYCGWICSCGALAETLGDTHRHKMPHGPFWNRLNMLGQVFLAFAFILLGLRIIGWVAPGGSGLDLAVEDAFAHMLQGQDVTGYDASTGRYHMEKASGFFGVLKYEWMVDVLWAGIIGYGLYFWFSGRVWCRFACPLAALMHIYARFSRFGIIAEKKKCISCNVCTSVCHQGIDIMSFANKGLPMQDPECVRCSACVQSCPTGVLSFGQVDQDHNVISKDPAWLAASPVQMAELTINGKRT